MLQRDAGNADALQQLGELCLQSDVAVQLAADDSRRQALRTTMRQRMTNSPLMNATSLAREIERAYGKVWRRWCDR